MTFIDVCQKYLFFKGNMVFYVLCKRNYPAFKKNISNGLMKLFSDEANGDYKYCEPIECTRQKSNEVVKKEFSP